MDSQPVIDNPLPLTESKTARKKKAKAVEAGTNGASTPALPQSVPKEDSSHGETPADSASPNASEHPHLRELQKQIRAVNKKLGALSKTDAIQAENPGVSLDDLVAQRKINNDQRASAAKKPALQEQLKGLEEQTQVFTKLHGEFQETLRKNKEELSASHKDEVEKVREESGRGAQETSKGELRKKLLVFSQFLRAAASKRNVEEDAGNEENMAFEGALLLVYGGDEKAVEAAVNIIDGSEEKVPSIEGVPLGVKYSTIKQASIDHAPFQTEEEWIDSVAEANAAQAPEEPTAEAATPTEQPSSTSVQAGSDPTLTHAGLTEQVDTAPQTNGTGPSITSPVQTSAGDEAGNLAGDRWDTGASGAKKGMDESFEMVPRPNDEVDTPVAAAADPAAVETSAEGNSAGEAWDTKAAGDGPAAETGKSSWADETTQAAAQGDGAAHAVENDGFQQIPGRQRGGGGRGGFSRGGRGGDGEFRGRGRGGYRGGEGRGGRGDGEYRGRGRGDGELRGRGRGGFRGSRGGEGGEGRGRGGRGGPPRGQSGEAPAPARV